MTERETMIIGVDFSGAATEGKTWICEGKLVGSELCLTDCLPITRSELTDKLKKLKGPIVVAMDFPFSMPEEFINSFWIEQNKVLGGVVNIVWSRGPELESGRLPRMRRTSSHSELPRPAIA